MLTKSNSFPSGWGISFWAHLPLSPFAFWGMRLGQNGNTLSMSTPTGVSWEAKLDRKEYPVKGTYTNGTVSVKSLGDRSIEVTYRRDGKVESTDKITVSGRRQNRR